MREGDRAHRQQPPPGLGLAQQTAEVGTERNHRCHRDPRNDGIDAGRQSEYPLGHVVAQRGSGDDELGYRHDGAVDTPISWVNMVGDVEGGQSCNQLSQASATNNLRH